MGISDDKFRITGAVIGCAMKVHRYFGSGFTEMVYHRSLLIELSRQLDFESEVERVVTYDGFQVGKRRIDLIVEKKVLVELKAISVVEPAAYNQVMNCMKVFGIGIGLLLNFGRGSLEFKRFVL